MQGGVEWLFKNFFYLLLRDRERQSMSGRGAERETDTHTHRIPSRLQAPSCQHRARRGARTHEPRDRDLSRSQTLHRRSHPGALEVEWLLFKVGQKILTNRYPVCSPSPLDAGTNHTCLLLQRFIYAVGFCFQRSAQFSKRGPQPAALDPRRSLLPRPILGSRPSPRTQKPSNLCSNKPPRSF